MASRPWPSIESFNIHLWFTSRKSLDTCTCTWSSAPYTVTEKLLYIIKGPMKVISGLLSETWGYFCMKNFISTTRNCHSHIHESTHFILFALLKVHPRFFYLLWLVGPLISWALGRRPGWPPLSVGLRNGTTQIYRNLILKQLVKMLCDKILYWYIRSLIIKKRMLSKKEKEN
jgi:hypothetical protein